MCGQGLNKAWLDQADLHVGRQKKSFVPINFVVEVDLVTLLK